MILNQGAKVRMSVEYKTKMTAESGMALLQSL
jgi:hypothetical protein